MTTSGKTGLMATILAGFCALGLAGCGGGTKCGAGTTKVDGQCVPLGGGPLTLCGTGTVLEAGTNTNRCVPSNSVCGTGTQLNSNGDACILSNSVCGPGTQPDGTGRCILSAGLCGPGTQQNGTVCEPLCGPTEIFDGSGCITGSSTSCGMFTAEDMSGMCVPAARIQVIHNSADPALATVDIYLDDVLWMDDMDFRTATPFADIVANPMSTFKLAPSDSTDSSTAVLTEAFNLVSGTRSVLVVSGVGTGTFAASPGVSPPPNLSMEEIAAPEETFTSTTEIRFNYFNGVIDGDLIELGSFSALYGNSSGYVNLPEGTSVLDAVDLDGPSRVGSFQTSIRGTANAPGGLSAGTVGLLVSSGFANPSANMDGAAFGVLAVFPDGSTALLDRAARLQVVHAAADPGLASVDVYVDGALGGDLTALAYESATEFLTVPSDSDLDVDIVANGQPIGMSLTTGTSVRFNPGDTAVAIAAGVETPADFDANPGAVGTGLAVHVVPMALEEAPTPGMMSLAFFHAVTDATPVDINPGFGPAIPAIADDLFYAEVGSYLELDPGKTALDVTVTGGAPVRLGVQTSVNGEAALMDGFPAGQAGVVIATGFLDNLQGPLNTDIMNRAVTLSLVTPEGGFFPLDQAARLQLIHNAADPALATVDVDVGAAIGFTGVAFREATPFGTVPSGGFDLEVFISGGASVLMTNVDLVAGSTNQAIAVGVDNTTGFAVVGGNPPIDFTVLVNGVAQEAGASLNQADFNFVHGVSDVGSLDDVSVGAVSLGTALPYQAITGYGQQVEAVYEVNVDDGVANTCWSLNLTGREGEAMTLLYSGFDVPGSNNGGPALELLNVRPDGTVVVLTGVTCS